MYFYFLVNTFSDIELDVYMNAEVDDVSFAPRERGFLGEGCYSSHFCCPTKRGRVYLKCRLFHHD